MVEIKLNQLLLGVTFLGGIACNQSHDFKLKEHLIEKSGNIVSKLVNNEHNNIEYVNQYLDDMKLFLSKGEHTQFIQKLDTFTDADKIHIIRFLHFGEYFLFDQIYQDFLVKFSTAEKEIEQQVMAHIRNVSNESLCFDNFFENIETFSNIMKKTKPEIKAILDLLELD